MKRWFGLLTALILSLSMTLPALAAAQLDCITDEAGLLSESEWTQLETRAGEIGEQYRCGVYVVIVKDYNDFGSDPENACGNIYETYTLGYGPEGDALVLLLSMAERDYWLQDYGTYGEFAMTDFGRETLEEAMLDNFANDDWYGGLSDFLEQSAVLLAAAETGEPLDLPPLTTGEAAFAAYGAALVVGLIAALITCTVYKSQMKTAVRATSAEEYVVPGGVEMQVREDLYTHTTRKERYIQKKSSGSGNSGGGGKF